MKLEQDKKYYTIEGKNQLLDLIDKTRAAINGSRKSIDGINERGDANLSVSFTLYTSNNEVYMLRARLLDYENDLRNSVVLEPHNINGLVDVGDRVKLLIVYPDGESKTEEYNLTGLYRNQDILDFENITLDSPIGRAIYGKPEGSNVEAVVQKNGNSRNIDILKITIVEILCKNKDEQEQQKVKLHAV